MSWQALTTWIQVLATLLASILVWLVYAVNVIRFVWLPSIYEFILPFWVGFIQLLMVQFLAPIDIGGWFIIASVLFGTMIWISQSTMRKARLDRGNASFFYSYGGSVVVRFYSGIRDDRIIFRLRPLRGQR